MTAPLELWWNIEFEREGAEEHSHELWDLGIEGLEVAGSNRVRCFFCGTAAERDALLSEAARTGFECIHHAPVQHENWVQKCADLWQPVSFGSMRIVPIAAASMIPAARTQNDLYLVPGMGFGTGHHPSTAMILNLLHHPHMQLLSPSRILDVGTGSGVLSIAAHGVFDAPVQALDTDSDAIINASENAALNGFEESITFTHGTLPLADTPPFDLVIANIYAEVLCQIEPHLASHTRTGGLLCLSGILDEKRSIVENCFSESRWERVESVNNQGWTALLFRRIVTRAD